MRLFNLLEARHFCNIAASGPAPAGIDQSLKRFHEALPPSVIRLNEGGPGFVVHRLNLLHSVERWTLYSLAHYRRMLDMMRPASAPWAQVTLYYSSFFAANAILGMFGGWVTGDRGGSRVVDVEAGVPGSQVLKVHRRLPSPAGATGSHKAFWDFFYDAAPQVAPWAPSSLAAALSPVNGDYAWQIGVRNDVNYDMFHAWAASTHLHATLDASRFRKSLTGDLGLQFTATERLLKLALNFADALALSTNSGLAGCGANGTRGQIQRRLASAVPPKVLDQSSWAKLLPS